jgi:DNA polymerase III epsilon subunit-like protein
MTVKHSPNQVYDDLLDSAVERPLFFDIETAAHPRVEEWIPRPEVDLDNISAPSNWKDEEKIHHYIEDKKDALIEKADAEYKDEIAKAPLDADLGKIISIGTRFGINGDIVVRYVPDIWLEKFEERLSEGVIRANGNVYPFVAYAYETEQDLIRAFWQMLDTVRYHSCGYGILHFDLPFLLRRSFEYGIKPHNFIDLRRYQVRPYKDLMPILYNWTYKSKPMKWVASRYGIDNPNENMSGAMVSTMSEEQMLGYTAGDIYIITELYKMADGIYWPSEISG